MDHIHILLVEDNEGDILLTREALEEAKILTSLSVVKDGEEAFDFVRRQGNIPTLLCLILYYLM